MEEMGDMEKGMLVCKNAPKTITDFVEYQHHVLQTMWCFFLQVTPTLSSSSPQQWLLLLLLPHQAWDPYNSR